MPQQLQDLVVWQAGNMLGRGEASMHDRQDSRTL